eukprot:scaffold3350_cov268-Pinguiococcus_pyrenoidosus.AAC.10
MHGGTYVHRHPVKLPDVAALAVVRAEAQNHPANNHHHRSGQEPMRVSSRDRKQPEALDEPWQNALSKHEVPHPAEEQKVPRALRKVLIQLETSKDEQEHLRSHHELGQHIVGEEAAAVHRADEPAVIQHAEHHKDLQQGQVAFLEGFAQLCDEGDEHQVKEQLAPGDLPPLLGDSLAAEML